MFEYVSGLPNFLLYISLSCAIYCAFIFTYSKATPHEEFALIRSGNLSAVVAFLGSLIGLSFPVAAAATHSVNIFDFLIWSAIGCVVQIAAFYVANFTMNDLHKRITAGELSAGIWGGGIAILAGFINAACMSY